MKKKLFTLIMMLISFSIQIFAQMRDYNAMVVDAETGEALPYVNVYAKISQTGTLTNAEGHFRIETQQNDTLIFSCIGYEPMRVSVKDIKEKVRMSLVSNLLEEVSVKGSDNLLQRIASTWVQSYKRDKQRERLYFMRQTNLIDGETQMVEAYLKAHSTISVNRLSFMAGRHYKSNDTHNDDGSGLLWFSNLHHLLSLSPLVKNDAWSHVLVTPFNPLPGAIRGYGYKKRYKTDTQHFKDVEGRETIKVIFKEDGNKPDEIILCGNLYVDAATLRPIAFDGHLENFRMKVWTGLFAKEKPAQLNVHINYGDGLNAYQVTSLAYTLQCQDIRCQTILFAVDKEFPQFGNGINGHENMLVAVERSAKDDALWLDEVVMKTRQEERIASRKLADIAAEAEEPMRGWLQKIQESTEKMPQEKVYLHLDNHSYFLGDTIWFKAYVRQTDTSAPSTISNVLYVDLLDHDGYPAQRKVIQLNNGEGYGEFALKTDSSMYSGFYEIRAYTKWQRNWGRSVRPHFATANKWFYNKRMAEEFFVDYDKIYSRVVPVYDKPLAKGEYVRDMTLRRTMRYFGRQEKEGAPQIGFYPEGGNLVVGVPCHVAFEARTAEGECLDGYLQVGDQEVKTAHRGRGTFTIVPQGTRQLAAAFHYGDGKKVDVKLPKAIKSGISIHVEQNADSCLVHINPAGEDVPDTLGISIMHEGNLLAYSSLDNKAQKKSFAIESLSCGVNQITVFDANGRVWADRLLFKTTDSIAIPTIQVKADKAKYEPFSAVHITLSSTLSAQKTTSCSVAVRDKSSEGSTHDNGTILTEMLLSSEIKGFVPNPGWYFEKNDDEHRHALDLLMMTQGWRRFDWTVMVQPRTDTLLSEKELRLEGEVLKYHVYHKENKIERDAMLYMLMMADKTEPQKNDEGDDEEGTEKEPTLHETRENADRRKFLEEIVDADYNALGHRDATYRGTGYGKAPKGTIVHAEFIQGRQSVAREAKVIDGSFSLAIPFMQGHSIMHIAASDTTKWKSGHRHDWISPNEDEYPEFFVKMKSPFIHCVKPYDFYQTHLPKTKGKTAETTDEYTMKQVSVYGKNGRLIKRTFVPPALKADAYEAFNLVSDAGLLDGWMTGKTAFAKAVAHYFIGDMGIHDSDTIIILPRQSRWDAGTKDAQSFYLSSGFTEEQYNSDENGLDLNNLFSIDSVYVYTDFAPRRVGSPQYNKPNVPETFILLKRIKDAGKRATYRDRFTKVEGFSTATAFYSPDYSKQRLPESQHDYRRTLYWNPNLLLDENGEAHITLYNNARTTQISVDAAGQAADGTLLWGFE